MKCREVALFLGLCSPLVSAQVLTFTGVNNSSSLSTLQTSGVGVTGLGVNDALFNGINHSPLENPKVALSKLDLKAPSKAQKEYNKGYQLLMKKSLPDAVQHLTQATSMYPDYVAAYNALGSAYMGLGKNEEARNEFSHAAALDDHLPNSFLNLGCVEIALKQYGDAEKHIQQAAVLAPLDLQLLTALAYSQYMNHDYVAAVTTARQVHERKHARAAMVHLYAAAAWEAQGRPADAQRELDYLMKEDPDSPAIGPAKAMEADLRNEQTRPHVTVTKTLTFESKVRIQIPQNEEEIAQKKKQDARESAQLADAEADCPNCTGDEAAAPLLASANVPTSLPKVTGDAAGGYTFHAVSEEVALFFSATDHGRAIPNLTVQDVHLLDNHKAPAVITGFRNEDKLPLRLGLLIDTSDSISQRFKFEQAASAEFLKKVVTHDDDLAFVVGFANSVLLVQDFTHDQAAISRGIGQLVPAGGTALWDAISFAADKLLDRPETQPVARVLVVISDGEDNSSSATAKQAIRRAQRGEVTIYTISTRELTNNTDDSLVGDHALRTLAELTGGDAFTPGSVRSMSGSLKELEEVIRSRYLISYKPADFKRDGQYRPIEISAQQQGKDLRVFSRKGYTASPSTTPDPY